MEEKYSTQVLQVEVGETKEGVFRGLRKWSESMYLQKEFVTVRLKFRRQVP